MFFFYLMIFVTYWTADPLVEIKYRYILYLNKISLV